MLEIDETTLVEYEIMREAFEYICVDRLHEMSLQAWQNANVQATSRKGEPKFKRFTDFFDYSKEIEKLRHPKKIELKNMQHLKLAANANRRVVTNG